MSNSIIQAFKSLNIANISNASEHSNIYEVSFQYLSIVKEFKDSASFQVCLVALINLERYQKALELINKVPGEFQNDCLVEKAYVFYKTGHTEDLLSLYKILDKIENSVTTRAIKHIVAQDYYRNGFTTKALDIYRDLIETNKDIDNSLDLACNERAIIYQLKVMEDLSESPHNESNIDESYDFLLNDSLIHLANGQVKAAQVLLKNADTKCRAQNERDMSAEDLSYELAPIKLTEAYIHLLNHNNTETIRILETLKLEGINDPVIRMIINNNLYAAKNNDGINPNLIEREIFTSFTDYPLQLKLTRPQFKVFMKNHFLLAFATGTLSSRSSYLSSSFMEKWLKVFPGDLTPFLYKVLLYLQIGRQELSLSSSAKQISRKLFKFINSCSELYSELHLAAALLLASLNFKEDHFSQSIAMFEKIISKQAEESKFTTILVGVLVTMYERTGMTAKIEPLFIGLADKLFREDRSFLNDKKRFDFFKEIGFRLFLLKNEEASKKIFETLYQVNPGDLLLQVALGVSSEEKLTSCAKLYENTPSVEQLLSIDIGDLKTKRREKDTSHRHIKKAAKVSKKSSRPKFSANKNLISDSEFNPDSLDPERWYPMKLRSYYKPSKKDLKKAGGHQGALNSTPPIASVSNSQTNRSKKKKKNKK